MTALAFGPSSLAPHVWQKRLPIGLTVLQFEHTTVESILKLLSWEENRSYLHCMKKQGLKQVKVSLTCLLNSAERVA